jgi:hypothetical protein
VETATSNSTIKTGCKFPPSCVKISPFTSSLSPGGASRGRNSWRSCTACFYALYNCDKGLLNESLEVHSLAKISVGYWTGKYFLTRGLRLYTGLLNIGATTAKQHQEQDKGRFHGEVLSYAIRPALYKQKLRAVDTMLTVPRSFLFFHGRSCSQACEGADSCRGRNARFSVHCSAN